MSSNPKTIEALANREYKYGFVSKVEEDAIPHGLNEETIRLISAKKNEPEWMLDWRLKAYRHWEKLAKSAAEPNLLMPNFVPLSCPALLISGRVTSWYASLSRVDAM